MKHTKKYNKNKKNKKKSVFKFFKTRRQKKIFRQKGGHMDCPDPFGGALGEIGEAIGGAVDAVGDAIGGLFG